MATYSITSYSQTIGSVRPGSKYYYYPPDNALAIDPSGIVMAENSAIEWGTLGTTPGTIHTAGPETLNLFFQPLSPYRQIFDPHVVFDPVNQRFVVVADETNNSFSKSSLLVAVSKDANPADGWSFQSINSAVRISGRSTWADYPKVAVDGSNIVISTNQFTSSGANRGSEQFVLQDSVGTNGGLYNGGTSTVTATRFASAYTSVQEVSAPGLGTYAMSYTGNGMAVTFKPTSGTPTSWSVNLGSIDAGTSTGYTAAQPGSSWKLDAGDGRITDAIYANGNLWAVFEVNTGTATSPVPAVHWVELNTTTDALVAQGNITMAGATTFNPSIAVDGNGDALINFTASGSSMSATDYFSVMPAGTTGFSVPVPYQTSASTAYTEGSSNVARWGDYSSATADPSNPAGFWVSNEYATSATSWGTALDQITLGTGSSTLAFISSSSTTTGTGSPGTIAMAPLTGDTPDMFRSSGASQAGITPADLPGAHLAAPVDLTGPAAASNGGLGLGLGEPSPALFATLFGHQSTGGPLGHA